MLPNRCVIVQLQSVAKYGFRTKISRFSQVEFPDAADTWKLWLTNSIVVKITLTGNILVFLWYLIFVHSQFLVLVFPIC